MYKKVFENIQFQPKSLIRALPEICYSHRYILAKALNSNPDHSLSEEKELNDPIGNTE